VSGFLSDQGGTRRRYRLAGSTPLDAHVEDLAPAYALDALDPAERDLVERHARLCPDCARLLAEERRVVSLLPFTVPPARPGPDVKVALFARIAHAQRAAAIADLPPERLRTLPPTLTIPSSRPASQPAAAPAVAPPAPWLAAPAEPRSRLGMIASLASIPLLIALVAVGAWSYQLQNRTAGLEDTLANFGSGTPLQLYSSNPAVAGPQGQLYIGADQRQAMLRMRLERDPEREYRLVGRNAEGDFVPIADLEVDENGTSEPFPIQQSFDGYQEYVVEAKPADPNAEATAPVLSSGDINGSIGSDNSTGNNAAP
jgi:Putative zinc-finger